MKCEFRLDVGSVLAALLLVGPASTAQAAGAGSSGRFTVARYLELQSADSPRISPDGTQIIYTRSSVNTQDDEPEKSVWIVAADGQHHRFLARGSGAVWAPDGRSIAYVAEGRPKGKQIFVLHLSMPGPATQLTSLEQDPSDLHWSPDGRLLGFTMEVPSKEEWSVDLPQAPEGAKWAATPRYTERLHYRRDGIGLTDRAYRHLFVIAADGGAPRQVTTGDWSVGESVYEYVNAVDWNFTTDGRSAIVEGYKEGDPDHNDQDCHIYSVDLATGATRRLTMTPGGWRRPAVSPDGKTIAYVGFTKNDASYRVADLWTMSMDGSHATLRSRGLDREPQNLEWAPDGHTLYFTAEDHGAVRLYSWSLHGGIRPLTGDAQVIMSPSAARGAVAVVQSDFRSPPDVELIDPRRPEAARKLTHLNDQLLRAMALSSAEEIHVGSTGGARIQGWVVKPPDFDSSKRYPLLLEIHGGPYAMYNVAFNPSFQNFAANGYVVLFINPRGSTGYGSAFSDAIAKHYPGPDYDDLLAAVDAVLKLGYVDTARMYVAGCSGGGILSSWVIGHTDRFAAAAVRCPVTDWISLAGETDVPFYTYSFFRKPFWEDPSDWLEQSTLMHVGNIKTPTLLMTGELDRRTPIPQTEELYTALRYRGVPAALLRFDGEFHGTERKPSNWMRTQLYMMSWFRKWAGAANAAN